jgi:hypothetical protein
MSTISKPGTDQILSELAELRGVVGLLTQEAHLQAEMLAQIILLLTPQERPPGSSLHELIAALITRLDRQSVMLKEVVESQTSLRQNLANDIAGLLREGHYDTAEGARGASGGNGRGPEGVSGRGEDAGADGRTGGSGRAQG